MKAALLLLGAGLLLAGCSTHSDEQIAAVRAAGVSSRTVAKLRDDRVILPEDIIELRRRRVSDSVPIRHLREVGVDYVPQRDDLRRMRSADVRPVVIDEVVIAGQRFAADRSDRSAFAWGIAVPYYAGYPYYDYPWGYGGYYGGYSYGHYDRGHSHSHRGHGHRHHRH